MAQVAIKFRGDDEGARATAESVAKALDKLGLSAGSVKFDVAQKGSDGLYQSLRGLKSEAIQHERVFGFFGRQLAETGLIARDTASAMVGLGAGIASGMWVLAAVEGVKLVAEAFKGMEADSAKAAKKAADDWKTFADGLARRAQEVSDKVKFFGKPEGTAEKVKADAALEESTKKLNIALAAEATTLGIAGVALRTLVGLETQSDKLKREQTEKVTAAANAQTIIVQTAAHRGLEAHRDAIKDAEKATEAHALYMLQAKAQQAEGEARIEAELAAEIERIRQRSADMTQTQFDAEVAAAQKASDRKLADYRVEQELKRQAAEQQARVEEADRRAAEQRARGDKEKRDLDVKAKQTQELATAGYLAADAFGSLGEAIGGTAGKMSATLGKLIQQAIQLAIAMSAELPPPLGLLNMAASAAAILATISSVPRFAAGTPYVPQTGLALVHQGERIIPARENALGLGGGITVNIHAAALDRGWWHQNQRHILAEIRDAARNRRTV